LEKNLVKRAIKDGGSIHPLIIASELTSRTGLMNPSLMVKDDKIVVKLWRKI